MADRKFRVVVAGAGVAGLFMAETLRRAGIDFTVYENGHRQEISHFSSERTPVSLGILLDTSGSMTPDKMSAARSAIDRFIYDLLDKDDELFFMEFASQARVLQAWTTDRAAISQAVSRVEPVGGTAIYDAIAKALPMAAAGNTRRKRCS